MRPEGNDRRRILGLRSIREEAMLLDQVASELGETKTLGIDRLLDRPDGFLKLLREWLSQEQLTQYDAHRYFEVIGCHTGKRYRICHGTAANVFELDDAGLPREGWCFVPNDHLVAVDVMLAQKIGLETDERGALATANNFTPR
jgi:hypothetical protein